jgi:uncharacterized lipoprotein NlpE involved in copper resistance
MKRILLVVFFVLLSINFFSCETVNRNLKNSSVWAGVYAGIVPAADSEGIDTTVTLSSDGTYEVYFYYVGKSTDVFIHTGTFKLSDDGNTVILDTEELAPFYRIGENTLTQLDMDGKIITGDLAGNYVLKRK